MFKITAEVKDGNLVCQHPNDEIDNLLGKRLNWKEITGTRQTVGSFFQADFFVIVSHSEAEKIKNADIEHISIQPVYKS